AVADSLQINALVAIPPLSGASHAPHPDYVDIPEHVDPLPKRWLRLCFSMTFRRMLTPLKCFSRNKVAPGAKKTEHIDPVSNSCFQKSGAC
ncbi:hypothetical protein, partial [Saccharicrinis sp. GN24d3]|uniref:hypothetical protein n=1 Tax=Saccharicrinis sp. GN24d3 TaxID=3458416 RepID=UPI004036E10D